MEFTKSRAIGVIHAIVSLVMLIILIALVADKAVADTVHFAEIKGIYILLIVPFAANLLASLRMNFHVSYIRWMISLSFALKAVQALCFSVLFFDTMSTASLAVSVLCMCAAIFEGKLGFDYYKNEHVGAASRCILIGFCILHLAACCMFIFSADITFGYELPVLAAGSAVCYGCLLIRSFGSKKEEAV